MSPRNKLPSPSLAQSTAAIWLSQNCEPIATAGSERLFALHSDFQKKYGVLGRRKCYEDALYHLHYLSEAVANDSEKIFVDYVGWAKIMLSSRGIDPVDLVESLEVIAHVLSLKAPRKHRTMFRQFINAAAARLSSLPETMPSFIHAASPWSDLANSYLNYLLLLNQEDALALIARQLGSGLSITSLFNHVIYPVQQEVGRLWQENRITVVQEHYCTATTDVLITRLQRQFLGAPRGITALAICADGEEHCLGLKMLSNLLEADGWTVIFIGPRCPVMDVLKHLKSVATDLVALSVATPLNLAKTRQLITQIRLLPPELIPSIIVGGAAFATDPHLWKRLGADGSAATITDGLKLANRLLAPKIQA